MTIEKTRRGETLELKMEGWLDTESAPMLAAELDAVEEKPFEEFDSGGMGLNLIRRTASDLRYERRNGMNLFTLEFPL